jgi:hypothetical protein
LFFFVLKLILQGFEIKRPTRPTCRTIASGPSASRVKRNPLSGRTLFSCQFVYEFTMLAPRLSLVRNAGKTTTRKNPQMITLLVFTLFCTSRATSNQPTCWVIEDPFQFA